MDNPFLPRDKNEASLYAEEKLILAVQAEMENLLQRNSVSRAELARRLDVSEARVSQIFSSEPKNLTLRIIARVFHVLGEEASFTASDGYRYDAWQDLTSAWSRRARGNIRVKDVWTNAQHGVDAANENDCPATEFEMLEVA